ncbi:magnesium-dependent phosphatase-1 [Lineolata rhizophorae]|uniref:Magnesium-dependent phosphatase-1 n=1 Tax=Lineolata rhizophorae TaxID=578093 RepID=A0A6A6P9B7_9PEZI|nr:magnesium-dependent phosphatase-1 [Lineolata rhizophorae]
MPRRRMAAADNTASTTALPASSLLPDTFTDGLPLPKLIVFDLDYTLWPFWVDTHVTPPLKAQESGRSVKDRFGESFNFYNDVPAILDAAKSLGIKVGAASRTGTPHLARDMLKLLRISRESNGSTEKAIELFDYLQIFPGSKKTHFARIHDSSSISYDDMLFFDDESRNRDVESLGVVMWLVRDGVTTEEVDKGIESWRRRNKKVAN